MKPIKLLPTQLANQIAAGEVIERPASVIKELLENAIDAGASFIRINLEKAGTQFIQVTDNGHGIRQQDLVLALSRHATSKISSFDDLMQIASLGFRGEALASISSVSRTCLLSKTADSEQAWQVTVRGEDMVGEVTPAAHETGTTVEVRDLFFNAPVRRKFLRSETTEFYHIEEMVKRLALSASQVAIQLQHNGKLIKHYPVAHHQKQMLQRLRSVFGKNFSDQALYLDVEATGLRLHGWLGPMNLHRSQSDMQYFYLNQRMVRDKLINHALRQVLQPQMPEGRFALYCLFLSVEPNTVDVNVHPTKHEVRFHEGRLVHDFIVHALSQVFSQQQNQQMLAYPIIQQTSPSPAHQVQQAASQYYSNPAIKSQLHHAENFLQQSKAVMPKLLRKRFLMEETEQGVALIDMQRLLENYCVMAYQQAYNTGKIASKNLLMPVIVNLQPEILQQFLQQPWQDYGFKLAQHSAEQLKIFTVPQCLKMLDVKKFFLHMVSCDLTIDAVRAAILSALLVSVSDIDYLLQQAPKALIAQCQYDWTDSQLMNLFS